MIAARLIRSPVTNDYCSSRSKPFVVIDICEKGDKTLIDLFEEKVVKILCKHVHVLQNGRANLCPAVVIVYLVL